MIQLKYYDYYNSISIQLWYYFTVFITSLIIIIVSIQVLKYLYL